MKTYNQIFTLAEYVSNYSKEQIQHDLDWNREYMNNYIKHTHDWKRRVNLCKQAIREGKKAYFEMLEPNVPIKETLKHFQNEYKACLNMVSFYKVQAEFIERALAIKK